jgi:hypothetical protein
MEDFIFMTICDCYRYNEARKRHECLGTKECEECTCCGDESKCNFYPERREKAVLDNK